MTEIASKIIKVISEIEIGSFLSYKEVAFLAGNERWVRQVVRVLKIYSFDFDLPWWRVVNSKYQVAIKDLDSFNEQIHLLRSEGHNVSIEGKILIDKENVLL